MPGKESPFAKKLRVRACGLLIKDGNILLAQMHSPITNRLIWIPPGGGLTFNEPLKKCLEREFHEETNLSVEVGELVHVNEVIRKPYHALECYFEVKQISGKQRLGRDPELSWDRQLLHDLQWFPISELPVIDFVPFELIPKIRNWNNHSDFPLFSEQQL